MNNISGILVKVDNSQKLNYEKINLLNKLFGRLIVIPFFNILPWRLGTLLFAKSSKTAAEVHRLAKLSNALEFLYNFDGKINFTNNFLDGIFTYSWQHNIVNAKAVRNRIKLVKEELKLAVVRIYRRKSAAVNIFSLASGSARAVIEVMADLKREGIPTKAKLLDLSLDAINLSKKIALEDGVGEMITWCNDKVSNFFKYCNNWQPDLIEMVGFLDYLNQEKALLLTKKIYNELSEGGIFITCNIKDNYEHKFVSKIVEWEMIYRDKNSLAEILIGGGFDPRKCKIIYEPLLIHGLAIGEK